MDKIDELLSRGVDSIYPSREELEKLLRSGGKITLYQGFDPTGSDLHIGHLVGLRKLAQFQKQGHKVIFLIGDFTGMVGDPSGKTTVRKMLTVDEVKENAHEYIKQAGKVLDFEGDNPAQVKRNSEWLGKLSTLEFMQIASNLSVSQVSERDLFQERAKTKNEVFINEFLYPILQAYDSVAMDVDLEIGATDQMFNMMMGRKLMRNLENKDKFVLTTPLLVDSEGKKIGKTEGNVIGISDAPQDLYAKILSLSDEVIINGLEWLTDIPVDVIADIKEKIKTGANPIEFKKLLAFEIVKQLNDLKSAEGAQEQFEGTVQRRELPSDIPEFETLPGAAITDILVDSGAVESRSRAKQLIEQGGIEIDGKKLKSPSSKINIKNGSIIQVGKHKYLKVKMT